MTQIEIPYPLVKQLQDVMDKDPVYRAMCLSHPTAYVREALKDFVKCKAHPYRNVVKREVDRILIAIVKNGKISK